MTTYIAFRPSLQAPFQFQATLDGEIYTVICTWNLFGQRFYINIYDLSNNLIVCRPQVGSPPTYNINLAAGYFQTSVLVFRTQTGNFEIDPPTPTPLVFPPPVPIFARQQYFINDGGVLVIGFARNYPTDPTGLPVGAVWDNGSVVSIAGSPSPDPSAPPIFFNSIAPPQLLAIGGANLPLTPPSPGSRQLYNNGNIVCIA